MPYACTACGHVFEPSGPTVGLFCRSCRPAETNDQRYLRLVWTHDSAFRRWITTFTGNLAIAAGLCRAFDLGADEATANRNLGDAYEDGLIATVHELKACVAKLWWPGCGRSTP